jgi:hypothetical protein
VSDVLGLGPERPIFLFTECHRPLWYLPALDVVVALEIDGPTLHLRDVVGPRLPSLDALVAELPGDQRDVETYFSPDLLAPPGSFVAHPNDPTAAGNPRCTWFERETRTVAAPGRRSTKQSPDLPRFR